MFDLLMETSAMLFGQGKSATLRVAGGWVRDKLLGNDSKDIDIALDTVTGAQFAEALQKMLTNSTRPEAHNILSSHIGSQF